MMPSKVSDFNRLTSVFVLEEMVRRETTAELMEIVRTGEAPHRIKAIELLGALRVQDAEPTLADAFTRAFPTEVLCRLRGERDKTSSECVLLVKLLTALVLIDLVKWQQPAEDTARQFADSWIEKSLVAIIATLKPTK